MSSFIAYDYSQLEHDGGRLVRTLASRIRRSMQQVYQGVMGVSVVNANEYKLQYIRADGLNHTRFQVGIAQQPIVDEGLVVTLLKPV